MLMRKGLMLPYQVGCGTAHKAERVGGCVRFVFFWSFCSIFSQFLFYLKVMS